MFPEARSTKEWIRQGWHVIVAYIAGISVMLVILGWNPETPHRDNLIPTEHSQQ
jgi:hypothetical protein